MPLRDAQLAIRAIEALHNLTEGMKSGHQSFFLALVFHLQFVFPEPMFQYYPAEDNNLPTNPFAAHDLPDVSWSGNHELFHLYADISQLNVT